MPRQRLRSFQRQQQSRDLPLFVRTHRQPQWRLHSISSHCPEYGRPGIPTFSIPSWSPMERDHLLGLISQSVPWAIKSPGCPDAIDPTTALCYLGVLMVCRPVGSPSSAQCFVGSELFLPAESMLAFKASGMWSTSGIDRAPTSMI